MRKAKKYLFFDIQTGQLVFEYGGVNDNTITLNYVNEKGVTKETKVYKLGLEVKEIREDDFLPFIVLHFAGNYLNHDS